MANVENELEFDAEAGFLFFFKQKKCMIFSSINFEFFVLFALLPLGFYFLLYVFLKLDSVFL
jgi:hypothetical protein